MREIYPKIYTFPIALPKSPLREIHSYIIKGETRTVVIDTGYNLQECMDEMQAALRELDIEMSQVDLLITHLHADHSGLASDFYDAGARIYSGQIDGDLFNSMASGEYWDMLGSFADLYGMNEGEMPITANPGYLFKLSKPVPFEVLKIGDHFRVDDFDFEIVDLIGHTPGHIGLFDRQKKIMFSADTVLDPITPNITFWGWEYPNILKTYMKTLLWLRKEDVEILFPGHRKVIENHQERIDQLIVHHFSRLEEILNVMPQGQGMTVRDVSARISWRIKAPDWESFPPGQKWFASGETMAHLDFLVKAGCLSMQEIDGTLYFTKILNQVPEAIKAEFVQEG